MMGRITYKKIRSRLIYLAEKLGIADYLRQRRNERVARVELPFNERLEAANQIFLKNKVDDIVVGLVKDIRPHSYWDKFERFLKNNHIKYEYYNIHLSNFAQQAKRFNLILWHPNTDAVSQAEAKSKIEFIQKYLGIKCLPNAESLWFYEDKIRQAWLLKEYGFPLIPTFVTYSKDEALQYIKNAIHPIIFKESTSSGSFGVFKSDSIGSSSRIVKKIFGIGRKSTCPTQRQKNYVYIQEMVPNKGYDLRVIVVGNYVLGYYRYPDGKDFRASGAGNVVKKGIPTRAMDLARSVKAALPYAPMLAVDLLEDTRDDSYKIIEISIFIGCETCEQLMINGVPGRYVYHNGQYSFEEGRFWIQELMLEDYLKTMF